MGIGTGLTATLASPQPANRCRRLPTKPPGVEREAGIEPASLAWKAKVLPLNYSRPGSLGLGMQSMLWWRRLDSNQRTQCGQIYSLLPLTTRPPLLRQARNYSTGQRGRNRASPRRTKRGRAGSPPTPTRASRGSTRPWPPPCRLASLKPCAPSHESAAKTAAAKAPQGTSTRPRGGRRPIQDQIQANPLPAAPRPATRFAPRASASSPTRNSSQLGLIPMRYQ